MTNKDKNTGLDIPNFCTSTKPKMVHKGKDVNGRNRVAMFALLMAAFLVGSNLTPAGVSPTNCEVTPNYDIVDKTAAEEEEITPEPTPVIQVQKSAATLKATPAAPEVKEPTYVAPETPKAPESRPEVKPTPVPTPEAIPEVKPTPTPVPPTPIPTPIPNPEPTPPVVTPTPTPEATPTPEVPACRVVVIWEYDEPQKDGSLIHFGATEKAPGSNALNIKSAEIKVCD